MTIANNAIPDAMVVTGVILAILTMAVTTAVMHLPIFPLYRHLQTITAINLPVHLALHAVETTEIVMAVTAEAELHRRLPRCLLWFNLLKVLLLRRNKWIRLPDTTEAEAEEATKAKIEITTIIAAKAAVATIVEHQAEETMAMAVDTAEVEMKMVEEGVAVAVVDNKGI